MTRIPLSAFTHRVFFVDPASSKKMVIKRTRARSAIVGLGQDHLSRIFVIYAWADRVSADALTEKIFEVNATFRPKTIGIEANAMQTLYAQMVGREAKLRAKSIPITEVKQPTNVDKDWRIRTALQPVVAHGRLIIGSTMLELASEMTNFPMSPTKDIIDALASAIKLLPPVRIRRSQDDELENRLRYLRETGAPMNYILQVANGAA